MQNYQEHNYFENSIEQENSKEQWEETSVNNIKTRYKESHMEAECGKMNKGDLAGGGVWMMGSCLAGTMCTVPVMDVLKALTSPQCNIAV